MATVSNAASQAAGAGARSDASGQRAGEVPKLPRTQMRPDFATVIGLAASFAMVGLAIMIGGSPAAFINLPGLFIVLGGTIAVTTVSFTFGEMARTQKVLLRTAFHRLPDTGEAALLMIGLADAARRNGILSLQDPVEAMRREPFLYRCMALIVDGTPAQEVDRVMEQEIHAMTHRHQKAAGILRKAAEVAPAMGLIGTLVGLVQMLGNLEDPSTIGPSMAVALLTTFYGAILGNMVFAPLAAKLERNSGEEGLVHHIYLMGATSIGRQENPRRLEMLINTVLPPAKRVRYFD
ncbi:MAG: flagellar motor protein MotA [Rhodospirillaceae bacterium]|jgi:chemotaxis protein MotA|nr:flagellar motor protein MotA [Rhodospirillaceae bacterium]